MRAHDGPELAQQELDDALVSMPHGKKLGSHGLPCEFDVQSREVWPPFIFAGGVSIGLFEW